MDKEDRKHSSKNLSEDNEVNDSSEFEKYEVENFIKHYSHEHALRLMSRCEDDKEEVGDDDDEAYKSKCRICGVPILSSPSYTCTLGCQFIIHQPCALQLSKILIHPTHGSHSDGDHTLHIQEASTNFIYKCKDCQFSLHPLVAFPHLEIKIKHKSHPSHSLVVFCKRRITCECDACGREEEGFFFYCGDCNFWIHQDCTILPTTLQFHKYIYPDKCTYFLAYSLPSYYVDGHCIFCREKLLVRHNGVYFCPEISTFAHAACGSTYEFASLTRLDSIQLPDDEWDNAFPILVIRRYTESVDGKLRVGKYLSHRLILIDDGNTSRELTRKLCCNLCTRTINISSSFYKCDECDFAAHKLCVNILPVLEFFIPGNFGLAGRFYRDPSATFFNSVFYCIFCRRPCNGVCFDLDQIEGNVVFVDLECMATPSTINHASHRQHLLIRMHQMSGVTPLTCCSDNSFFYDVYRCLFCDYYIHTSCTMLPKRIICHDYDEHPLHLVFTTTLSYSFCEVCEEDIDLKYWLYQCRECDKSFHINCIPSLGYLSKVKFGGMLSLPNFHIHPLALTRMLTIPSQRCGYCNKIIQGLLDQMAFFCSHCHFWLHFSCARDANATPNTTDPLKLYSEIDYEKFISDRVKDSNKIFKFFC